MKTAEEIAGEIVHQNGGDGPHAYRNIIAAIEADRAQRGIYELLAEAMDERADNLEDADSEAFTRYRRAAAKHLRSDDCEAWGDFIGPMLDEMEIVYGQENE